MVYFFQVWCQTTLPLKLFATVWTNMDLITMHNHVLPHVLSRIACFCIDLTCNIFVTMNICNVLDQIHSGSELFVATRLGTLHLFLTILLVISEQLTMVGAEAATTKKPQNLIILNLNFFQSKQKVWNSKTLILYIRVCRCYNLLFGRT